VSSPGFSWVAGGIACMAVVIVAALLVRPFWLYDASIAGADKADSDVLAPGD
jgi:hypothetical protein